MSILEKMTANLFQDAEKIPKVTGKIVQKGKMVSSEGAQATKDVFLSLGGRISDITALVKIKYEMASLTKQLEAGFQSLGQEILLIHRDGEFLPDNVPLQEQLKKLEKLDATFLSTQNEYDRLKMKHSSDYVINKLSEDLSEAEATIDQVIISEKSNVVNKLLKEILLPKEALISAVKREGDVIIPDGNTLLKARDQVIIIGKKNDVEKVIKRLASI